MIEETRYGPLDLYYPKQFTINGWHIKIIYSILKLFDSILKINNENSEKVYIHDDFLFIVFSHNKIVDIIMFYEVILNLSHINIVNEA